MMAGAFDFRHTIFRSAYPALSPFTRRYDNFEEHAMSEDEAIRQPQTVSNTLANYLDMTTPASRMPRRPRRHEPAQPKRPSIDNRGLSLEEGNDFA